MDQNSSALCFTQKPSKVPLPPSRVVLVSAPKRYEDLRDWGSAVEQTAEERLSALKVYFEASLSPGPIDIAGLAKSQFDQLYETTMSDAKTQLRWLYSGRSSRPQSHGEVSSDIADLLKQSVEAWTECDAQLVSAISGWENVLRTWYDFGDNDLAKLRSEAIGSK